MIIGAVNVLKACLDPRGASGYAGALLRGLMGPIFLSYSRDDPWMRRIDAILGADSDESAANSSRQGFEWKRQSQPNLRYLLRRRYVLLAKP